MLDAAADTEREVGEEGGQQQDSEQPLTSAYAACLTPESKQKGDAGIYAALDAMQLSRALHGVTDSRLDPSQQQAHLSSQQSQQQLGASLTAAGGGVAGARANGGSGSSKTVQLGVEPEAFRHGASAAVNAIFSDAVVDAVQPACGDVLMSPAAVRVAVQRGLGGGSSGTSSTAVGLPEEVDALERVLPLVHEVKPRDAVNFDALQRLFALMERGTAAAVDGAGGVTALLLAKGVVDPSRQPAPSTASWEETYNALQARYPLPTAASNKGEENENEDDEEEDGSGEGDRQHNAALQERCSTLRLPYKSYKQALRDVAAYEMRVFPLLCAYLSHNEACRERVVLRDVDGGVRATSHAAARHCACANVKVMDLSANRLGAAAVPSEADSAAAAVRQLAPLRALAAMVEANESLRYLNLRENALGPRGVGIIAKALTRNIALAGIDLSANNISDGVGEVEEVEDPLYEEDDAAFGEPLEGLDALAEVLKKNKFLRVLRLAENGLHAGEDLTGPPPPEEEEEEEAQDDEAPGEDEGQERQSDDNTSNGEAGSTRRGPKGLSMAAALERWQGVPLWTLLTPLHRYHRLRVLDLSKNLLGNTGAQMVAVAVAHNHSIEVLDLTDNAIGYRGLSYLARYILAGASSSSSSSQQQQQQEQHAGALHTLILRQNPLSCVGGAADAATGVDARRRRLTKRQQRQMSRAMETFAVALRRHGRLRCLVLANTYLGPGPSAVVLRALAHVPTLTELDFSFNNACGDHIATFDETAVPHIAALLYPSQRLCLQRLCLDGNNLTPAGLAALQPADADTPATPALRELTLSRNSLGDALQPLTRLLAAGLTRLDLSYNDISTMASLVHDLPPSAALTDLNLSHNKLGVQEGLQRDLPPEQQEAEVNDFLSCIAQLPSLEVADLSFNDWRPAHVEAMAAVFADPGGAARLRKLDVRHTPRVPAAPLMTVLRNVASRPTMEVFLASVPVEHGGGVGAEEGTGETVSYDDVVAVIHDVVAASASLVEVDCGLRPRAAVSSSRGGSDVAQATEEKVAEIRERLLLNALMAASKRTSASD